MLPDGKGLTAAINRLLDCIMLLRLIPRLILLLVCSSLQAKLVWEHKEVLAEAAFGQASIVASFPFKNTGDTTVTIESVETSCGCTYAAPSIEVIRPGEAAEIAVFFDTAKREGLQRSTIRVLTDDPENEDTILVFVTNIPPAITLPTRVIKWGAGDTRVPRLFLIKTQPGVKLKLTEPKKPLPVEASLQKMADEEAYQLSVAPKRGVDSGAGLLPMEASWDDGKRKFLYNVYVRLQ